MAHPIYTYIRTLLLWTNIISIDLGGIRLFYIGQSVSIGK